MKIQLPLVTSERALKERFDANDASRSLSCMIIMSIAHSFYNKKFFKGKLKQAMFRAEKPPKANVDNKDAAGAWFHWNHHIYLEPKVFAHTFDYFRTLMLHEMCHQAQTDIDHLDLNDHSLAHGTEWIKWMRHCGLAPALESLTYDIIPEDATKSRRANYMRSINKLNKVSPGKVHPDAMKFGQMLTFFDEDDNGTLVKAMYVTLAYHPEAHENMVVVVGEYHKPKRFDYHWPGQPMWAIDEQPSPELKKAGKSIIKRLGPK